MYLEVMLTCTLNERTCEHNLVCICHSAGLVPIGRFGGLRPPKSDLFVAAFCQQSWQKAATKEPFSGAYGPRSPAGELASSIICMAVAPYIGYNVGKTIVSI